MKSLIKGDKNLILRYFIILLYNLINLAIIINKIKIYKQIMIIN